MQVDHLASVRFGGGEKVTKDLCDRIDEKVDAYVTGDLGHAVEATLLLWEASKKTQCSAPVPQSTSASGFPESIFTAHQSGSAFGIPPTPSPFATPQTPVCPTLSLPFYR